MIALDAAASLAPEQVELLYNRGKVLHGLGRHEEAIESYQAALALKPDHGQAWTNLGLVQQELRRHDEALKSYDTAISLLEDNTKPNWNRAQVLLVLGEYEEGWRAFEWRKRLPDTITARPYEQPEWLGREDVAGKTVFLYWEQGFGDTIQFCRYALLVQAMGARVVLSVNQPLQRLIQTMDPRVEVIDEDSEPEDFDFHGSIMSLPYALGTTLDTIPRATRYLHADPEDQARWREQVADLPGLKVGLVWSGAARTEPRLASIDERRSMPLSTMAPLTGVAGVSFVSLQKGPAADMALTPPDGMVLHDWTDELYDFADTAALIEELDLVITVDTAVAHLAGALGKPVWVLNRFDNCWRWLLDRADSPWYPSARMFRQAERGNWGPVLEEVCRELAALVAHGG